jgi:hypothetical protein
MGRILLALPVALCALLLQSTAFAVTPEFQITPRIGIGSLKVDELVGVNEERIDVDTYGIGASAGYLTPIGVVVELGADNFSDFTFFGSFDTFELSQQFASIGYQFDLGHRWRLVPRVGRAHWKLHSKEGLIFNPGPEEVRDVRGDSYFWEIGVARQVSRVVTLGMTFKQGQYDFGRTQSAAFTVTLGFGGQ